MAGQHEPRHVELRIDGPEGVESLTATRWTMSAD